MPKRGERKYYNGYSKEFSAFLRENKGRDTFRLSPEEERVFFEELYRLAVTPEDKLRAATHAPIELFSEVIEEVLASPGIDPETEAHAWRQAPPHCQLKNLSFKAQTIVVRRLGGKTRGVSYAGKSRARPIQ